VKKKPSGYNVWGIRIHKITGDSRSGIKKDRGIKHQASYAPSSGGISTKSIGDIYIVTKGCKTDSGNVRLLVGPGGHANSIEVSPLDRVYEELQNAGGGDGVRSRDVNFDGSCNEVRYGAGVCICACACASSCVV